MLALKLLDLMFVGDAPPPANASRLQRQDSIRRRVEEILDLKQCATDRAVATAAERAGVDQYWVLRQLRINATMAMRRNDRAAAARSLELLGKHLGLFIDKKSIDISYIDDADEYLAEIMAIVDAKTVEHEPAPLAIGHEPTEQDDSVH